MQVEKAPVVIKASLKKEEADELVKKLEAGARSCHARCLAVVAGMQGHAHHLHCAAQWAPRWHWSDLPYSQPAGIAGYLGLPCSRPTSAGSQLGPMAAVSSSTDSALQRHVQTASVASSLAGLAGTPQLCRAPCHRSRATFLCSS